MIVAVVGSRKFKQLDLVTRFVQALPGNTHVVSGGALGPDTRAVLAAAVAGLFTTVLRPEWRRAGRYDPAAGFKRNARIVQAADVVVAFWDGRSNGTRDSISKAKAMGKPVAIYQEGR